MKTKFFTILLTCFIATSVFSQVTINSYKYVIVPNKFDFLKAKDEYNLNSLTKFLFSRYGFEAVMEGSDYPNDLVLNRCLALESDVTKESGLFKTKLKIELKDCNDKVLYTSPLGESREKEYKTAYNLALRDAFKYIEAKSYKYEPNETITSIRTSLQPQVKNEVSEEIQQLKEEIENLKREKVAEVAVVKKSVVKTPKVVEPQPKPKELKLGKVAEDKTTVIEGASNVLYAQEIENGFQLVDSSPKVVYRIKNTNLKNVFLVQGKNAIIYKKGDNWVIEYYSDSTLAEEALNVKF